ncbi:hypothetical protein NQ176_g4922 [Zarea fungicola]|uniref:Uncharacterized protein n=1 Tax=Zarea fungicola TaxID=93591 RepID=A0ACC1NDJ6_9HYPO|nr:hypothetical protein NQ176_g4922 [Lecanicillium fungicola]
MSGMAEERLELVQPENFLCMKSWTGNLPLFLFHDGGGSTLAYHCLEPMGRFVYGVNNPCFFKKPFESIPKMAVQYVKRVKATVAAPNFPAKRKGKKPVDILVGGWSLGGMTSLEVARQLAGDEDVRVKAA